MPSDPRQDHGDPPSDPIGSARRPLIEVDELAERLTDPIGRSRLRVVDVRWVLGQPGAGRAAFEAGHVPGAIYLDLDADLSDPGGLGAPGRHPLPSPRAFAGRLEAWGIGDQDLIVAYDDAGGSMAARLWWMLDDLGHTVAGRGGAAVLDGGWSAWIATGLPSSTEAPSPPFHPTQLSVPKAWTKVIERDPLRSRLGSVTLLDARAGARYRGEIEPVDPIPGHIPTAINAPWDRTLGPDGRFRPAEDLRAAFAELGVGADSPAVELVLSCGSGVTATQHAVAARLAGLPDPILYVGSYSDWSRSGLPVATGPEPGSPAVART